MLWTTRAKSRALVSNSVKQRARKRSSDRSLQRLQRPGANTHRDEPHEQHITGRQVAFRVAFVEVLTGVVSRLVHLWR